MIPQAIIFVGALNLLIGVVGGFFLTRKLKGTDKKLKVSKNILFYVVVLAWICSFSLEMTTDFSTPPYLHTFMGILVAYFFKPFDKRK